MEQKIYINKEDLDIALKNTVEAFVDKNDYEHYLDVFIKYLIDDGK